MATGDTWRMLDAVEMKAYILCLLNTNYMHQNKKSLDTLFNFVEGNPLLRAVFFQRTNSVIA